MIDQAKLETHIQGALSVLTICEGLASVMQAVSPDDPKTAFAVGKNAGARAILEAFQKGLSNGAYDAEAETIPAPSPESEDEGPFGVFYESCGGDVRRSVDCDGTYATRSEAWQAIKDHGSENMAYEVRAL